MATRKSQLTKAGFANNGVQSTDLQSTLTQEKAIQSNTLKNIVGVKDNPINRFNGTKTEVIYFLQSTDDGNDFLVNTSGFNIGDPNLVNFVKIDRMVLLMDKVNTSWDEQTGEGSKTPMYDGRAVVLPNTILPHPNDKFVMEYLGRSSLWTVTSVQPLSGEGDTAYELQFSLYIDYFTYNNSEMEKSVVENFILDQSHLSTGYRTIYKIEDYENLYKLRLLYQELGSIYNENFFNSILNTYLLLYENNLKNEYNGDEMITLSNNGARKVIVGDDNVRQTDFRERYNGKEMYDAELIEFINRNGIFNNIDNKPIEATQFAKGKRFSNYYKTVFYSVEKQDKRAFVNQYFLPFELNIASIDVLPTMYGKVNLLHFAGNNDESLDLFPLHLYQRVRETMTDKLAPKELRGNIYDQLIFLIALYINRFDNKILDFLLYIANNMDEFRSYELSIYKSEAFYLFPLIGFIIKVFTDKLVSKQVVNDIADPRDYNPS